MQYVNPIYERKSRHLPPSPQPQVKNMKNELAVLRMSFSGFGPHAVGGVACEMSVVLVIRGAAIGMSEETKDSGKRFSGSVCMSTSFRRCNLCGRDTGRLFA